MSLNLGELVGFLDLDAGPFEQGIDKAGGLFEKFGGKLGKLAAGFGVAAGVALAGGLLGSMDTEKANDKLAAQLGATPAMAKEFGGIAGDLYSQAYGESLGEVNDAIKAVWQSGAVMEDATTEQIKSVTAAAMDLATAFDQDVTGTARAAGQMVRTGLAKDATEALDILTRGFQQGGDKAEDLLDTFNEYPTQFRKLGLSGAAAMGLITQGLRAGARDSDIVADALKEFSIRAIDGSKLTAEGFKALGLNADRMAAQIAKGGPAAREALGTVLDRLRAIEDPVKRDAAAVALFGTQAEDMGKALLALDVDDAAAGLGKVGGAAAKMGQALNDNASTNIESFKRQVSTAFVDFVGGKALPVVNDIARTLATQFGPALELVGRVLNDPVKPALADVAGFLGDHQTAIKVVAGIITAVYLPALIAMGVRSLISGAQQAAGWAMARAAAAGGLAMQSVAVLATVGGWVLMGTQALLNAARIAAAWFIALGPVGWVIAAIVGLVALVILNWDRVKRWTAAAWHAVVEAVRAAVRWVIGAVGWLGALPARVGGWFLGVQRAAIARLGDLLGWLRGLPGRILGALGDLGRLLWGAGISIVKGLIGGIRSMAGDIVHALLGLLPGPLRRFAGALGIASPSTVFRDRFGRMIPAGLAAGIAAGRGDVERALGDLVSVSPEVLSLRANGAAAASLRAVAGGAATGVSGPSVIEVRSGGSRLDDLLVEVLRRSVRTRGGNVQLILGTP